MTAAVIPVAAASALADLLEEGQRCDRAGLREMARDAYEKALRCVRRGDGATAAGIARRIARSHMEDGQFDTALDCLSAALAISELHGDISGIAHALNWMANAQSARGDLDQADRFYVRALAYAMAGRDDLLEAMISQNRGSISSMRGDLVSALDHYASSLMTYRMLGLRQYLGPVLNNMGLVYTQLDRLDEAQAAYEEAVTHCDAAGDVTHRLLALINSAHLWLAHGDIDRAANLCDSVLTEATAAGDLRSIGETFRHLGVIARTRGDLPEAERQLDAALTNAMGREDLLLAAESSREQAELFEMMGKNTQMLQALSKSHQLFTKLRARHNLADLEKRIGRLETRFVDVVSRWAQTIESADAYTLGHCQRVSDYACALAREIGFDEITMFWFRIGALLHDVGKIDVPIEILNKPGRLTDEERIIIEGHAAAGAVLLRDIEFPWDIIPMVRGHHERWDGRGYPDQLAGTDIAFSARILCVADVYDALTTDRPYRAAFSRDQALAMMAEDNGKMFDPELFPIFDRVMRTTIPYRGDAVPEPIAVAS
ncbi:MAG: HD domain-containing phosphohydrolase [Gemmatimonadaceae bacterium]